jgi:hypothetical protein
MGIKNNQNLYVIATSWGSSLGIICLFAYVFAAAAALVNAVEIVSFGFGMSGRQKIVGEKRKRNVTSASTIIMLLR